LPGQNAAGSRLDPPDFGRLRDDRHRSGRKTLAQRAKSGDLEVKRKATWGMSVDVLRFDPSKIILSQGLAPGEMIVSAGTQ
ncbi:hypothetical protein, partial [Bacillus cereus]|uniref:hypothetical protein n=1 Tax=Bacillus cereus TaxID=1396 RepID=UPI0018DEEB9D